MTACCLSENDVVQQPTYRQSGAEFISIYADDFNVRRCTWSPAPISPLGKDCNRAFSFSPGSYCWLSSGRAFATPGWLVRALRQLSLIQLTLTSISTGCPFKHSWAYSRFVSCRRWNVEGPSVPNGPKAISHIPSLHPFTIQPQLLKLICVCHEILQDPILPFLSPADPHSHKQHAYWFMA